MISMLNLRLSSRSTAIRSFCAAFILLACLHFYLSHPSSFRETSLHPLHLETNNNATSENDDVCALFPDSGKVVITVKTGATEASAKIPSQLRTSLKCAPNVYIFSDMAQNVGKVPVYDALAKIPDEVKNGNTDFDIYRKQYELGNPQLIMSELKDFKDPRAPDALAAWTLDKYKNFHIVEDSWEMKPDMDWYLHIDADTYVIWSSFMAWIKKLDASKEQYLGSLSYIVGKQFGHGGSGIMLSKAAMRNIAVRHNGTAAIWDHKMFDNCCGDWALAQVLKEYGMGLKNAWPTIQGETADTIPFAKDHWCQPVVTMHHISSEAAERFGEFEGKRKDKSAPVIYSEIFHNLIGPSIPNTPLDDWDNGGRDEEIPSISSAEACHSACAAKEDCFQSLYNGKKCFIETKRIRFGEKKLPSGDEKWQSSWNKTRIEAWASKQKNCGKVKFPFEDWW